MKAPIATGILFLAGMCHATETVACKTWKRLEVQGYTLAWKPDEDFIRFRMQAPTQGWLALGINDNEGLQGAILLMAAIADSGLRIEEHFILAPGDHRSVVELGGAFSFTEAKGESKDGQSIISFLLPRKAVDRFHKDLLPDRKYELILAYSHEREFDHHSAMRHHVKSRFW